MEHYVCMVDLLARFWKISRGKNFHRRNAIWTDINIWGALLSACRIFGEIKMAEHIAKRIMALDSENIELKKKKRYTGESGTRFFFSLSYFQP